MLLFVGGSWRLSIVLLLVLNTPLLNYILYLLEVILQVALPLFCLGCAVECILQRFFERPILEPLWRRIVLDRVAAFIERHPEWGIHWQANINFEWGPNMEDRKKKASEQVKRYTKVEVYVPLEKRRDLSVREIKEILSNRGLNIDAGIVEKEDLLKLFENEQTSCAVCLDDYSEDSKILLLPCKHFFHEACLNQWVDACCEIPKPLTCPLCTVPLVPQNH